MWIAMSSPVGLLIRPQPMGLLISSPVGLLISSPTGLLISSPIGWGRISSPTGLLIAIHISSPVLDGTTNGIANLVLTFKTKL